MNRRPTRSPNFLWQGLLILLPASLLAGIGFLSLRQDRVLAEHDATAHARKIAADLALRQFPTAIRGNPIPLPDVAEFIASPSGASHDPIMTYSRGRDSRLAFLLNAGGDLIYPPPFLGVPAAQPLDESELSAEQRHDWTVLQNPELAESAPVAAVKAGQNFLESQPSERFAAAATYRLATLLRTMGELEPAWQLFETAARDAWTIAGETGVSLGLCAQLQLLQMAAANPKAQTRAIALLNSICARMILEPSALSRFVLETLDKPESASNSNWNPGPRTSALNGRTEPPAKSELATSIAQEWRQVFDLHEAARSLCDRVQQTIESLPDKTANGLETIWLTLDNQERYLISFQAIEGGLWIFAQDKPGVHAVVTRSLAGQNIPPYFGVEVEIAGERILDPANSGMILATSSGASAGGVALGRAAAGGATQPSSTFGIGGLEGARGSIKVAVHLTDSALLYTRQRVRTIWFGALIGASAIAVILGFMIARRAFQRQQQLNEMKTNFVSSVSHELRSPIASVRLMAEELEDIGPQDRQKNKEYHRFIVQECRRLSALIENVLDFSRHEQGRKQYEFEPTNLVGLVEETVKLMQSYGAGRCIGVKAEITGSPVPVELDGRAIQQVLVNLIDNAIKHSPPSSTVTVGMEFPATSGQIASTANHESRIALDTPRAAALHVQLWVEDPGEGIPPEDHERIFERFYRRGTELRRETQGVGLGLAIVKLVTEAHGGKVSVRSAPGQGSRFTVTLPMRQVEDLCS